MGLFIVFFVTSVKKPFFQKMRICIEKFSATRLSFLLMISVVSLLPLSEALTKPSGIKLVDNQYTGIVVAIHEDEQEDRALVDSIQRMFVSASSYLYNATKKRTYFKEVTILIPSTWSNDPSYGTVRNESFRDADVIIAPPNPRFSPKVDLPSPPYTKHYGGCGKEGIHIHFTSRFLLDRSLEDVFGDFGRLLVHEWGHFRWGLFNEYPDSIEDDRFSDHFYQSPVTGLYEPVSCPRLWNMSPMKYTGIHPRPFKRCNGNNREGYERGCLSVAEEKQPHFTASIMMNKHLSFEQIIDFCDNDTEDQGTLHNSDANNKHNRLCDGRSSWEVMREHDDFNDSRNHPREIEDVSPTFKIIRETEAGKPIVLVLDTSGSMSSMNRSKRLQSVAKTFLISMVAHGCQVGIVDFDSSAKILSHLREIHSETSRQELAGLIVGDHTGGTCIGCGIMEALKVIPANETGKVILITDGRDSKIADLMAAQDECTRRGIVVDSIAYSDEAQPHLRAVSEGTGGKFYLQTDDPRSRGALQAYSENSNCGRQKISSRRIPVFSDVYTLAAGNSEESGSVDIDPTIGMETKFIFLYFVRGNAIQVEVLSPTGSILDSHYTGYKHDLESGIITVNVLGIAEAGSWQFTIRSRSVGSYDVTVAVSSLPTTDEVPPIVIRSYLSGTEAELTPQVPFVAVAEVRQGLNPIINARVIATVERPRSLDGRDLGPVEMTLRDDGIGLDVTKNDGLYTRAFTNFTGVGFYGVSVRVENSGEALVLLPNTKQIASKFDEVIWNETISFNADRKTPNFNRECSAGASYVPSIPVWWTPEIDIFPPSTILDLALTYMDVKDGIVNISCTSPGGDMDGGKASSYVILRSNSSDQLQSDDTLESCVIKDGEILWGNLSSPSEFGTKEEFSISVPLEEEYIGTSFFFAVYAVDESGNRGKISNVVQATFRKDSIISDEKSNATHASRTTEKVSTESLVIPTYLKTTPNSLVFNKRTHGVSRVSTVDTQLTTDNDTINNELTTLTQQMTNLIGEREIKATAVVKMMSSEEFLRGGATRDEDTNFSAMLETDTKTTSERPEATAPFTIVTKMKSTTEGKSVPKKSVESTIGPKIHWRTDAKKNIYVTMKPKRYWKTGAQANPNFTISLNANLETDCKTDTKMNIDYTTKLDAERTSNSETDIEGTVYPQTDRDTNARKKSVASAILHVDGKASAKTKIEGSTTSNFEWKTALKTNTEATITSNRPTNAKTDSKDNLMSKTDWIEHYDKDATRPNTEWETSSKTNIDSSISSYTVWKTYAKTYIETSTIRPNTDLKATAKTTIDTMTNLKPDWLSYSKSGVEATVKPRTDLKTYAKSNVDSTTKPIYEWIIDAKTDIGATIKHSADWTTYDEANIDTTVGPNTDWEVYKSTNFASTIRPKTKSKTEGKTNIVGSTTKGPHLSPSMKANIGAATRSKIDHKTDPRANMDITIGSKTDWKTGVKTNIDSTTRPGFDWETSLQAKSDPTFKYFVTWKLFSNSELRTSLTTSSKYVTVPMTDVSKEKDATIHSQQITDGGTTKYNVMTTPYGSMNRVSTLVENVTEKGNPIKIGCETKYGWKEFNRECYKLLYFSNGRGHNFTTMLQACKEEGPSTFGKDVTRAVDITSKYENDFVADVVANGSRAWIGAKRDANGGPFIWKIGEGNHHDPNLDGFTNWKPNEPNNKWNSESCVEINRGPGGGWNDIKCRRKLPIICKYSLSNLDK